MNLCAVMIPKIIKNSNNLFIQQLLMHLTLVLCKITGVEYSRCRVNHNQKSIDIINSICSNLHEIMWSYETTNDEKSNGLFKQQFLIQGDQVLYKFIVIECLY
jgi:phosphate starvation-inducible protein PhoH